MMANEFNLPKTWVSGEALTVQDLNSQFDGVEDQLDVVELSQRTKEWSSIFESRDGWEIVSTGPSDASFYTLGAVLSIGAAGGTIYAQPSSLSPIATLVSIDFSKDVSCWFRSRVSHMNTSTFSLIKLGTWSGVTAGVGTDGTGFGITYSDDATNPDGNLYFFTSNGGVATHVQIPGVTATNLNNFTIVSKAGSTVTLYVNNSSAATITTNLPSTSTANSKFAFGTNVVSTSAQNMSLALEGFKVINYL